MRLPKTKKLKRESPEISGASWSVWLPRWDYEQVDRKRCRANVSGIGPASLCQCSRKPKVTRVDDAGVGFGFCSQHDPEAVARRDAERQAKRRAEGDVRARRWEVRRVRDALAAAVLASDDDTLTPAAIELRDRLRVAEARLLSKQTKR